MTKFDTLYNKVITECIDILKPFEDYSNNILPVNCIISEDSLSRTLSIIQDKDFAILTAYRANFTKSENILRNRKLRAILNELHMGVHQLVGHWQEAPWLLRRMHLNE